MKVASSPRLLASLMCLMAFAAPAAASNDADVIKGVRTNALYGGMPKQVAGFAMTESNSDPNRHTIRARYEHAEGDAAAVVNIRAVRAKGKVVELPDGPDSVAVGVNNVMKEYSSQSGASAERVTVRETKGGDMNCVKVIRQEASMVRLVCRTAVHGRMIESQSDARAGSGQADALALLETFTSELVAAVRQMP